MNDLFAAGKKKPNNLKLPLFMAIM